MYLSHFGLNEAPYRITPHTDFFFAGANRGATLEALLYAITHDEGIVKVTGEVGSGKTMLCRVLIERLPAEVETVYLANPSLARDEIVLAILDDLKLPAAEQRPNRLLRALQDHLIELYAAGKRVVLLIDEAHAMPAETLEEIRLLSNLESNRHKLLQIALFGQQELDEHLLTPRMRPLRERVTHSFRLEPLVHADVGQYLMFRLRQAGYKGPDLFDRDALKLIAQTSEGLTRRVNILADKALLSAYMEGEHGINRKHALAAINDSEFAPLQKRRALAFGESRWKRAGYWAGGGAAVALLLGGGMFAGALLTRSAAPVQVVGIPRPATAVAPAPPTTPVVTPTPGRPSEQRVVISSVATSTATSSPKAALATDAATALSGAAAPTPSALPASVPALRRPISIPLPVPQFSATVVPSQEPPVNTARSPSATAGGTRSEARPPGQSLVQSTAKSTAPRRPASRGALQAAEFGVGDAAADGGQNQPLSEQRH